MKPLQNAPNSSPSALDIVLADTAIRIQLSDTDYSKAVDRYETLAKWLERPGSLLAGKVDLVYPQGSMAIGSTIASKLRTDDFDIDLMAQLRVSPFERPRDILDALYKSVRGEPGSRYYDMTERRTRCVTVQYADEMHLDITPSEHISHTVERTSNIFHSKPEDPNETEQRVIANPYGFAQWFRARTPIDHDFAKFYEGRAMDYYDLRLAKLAETEEVPEHQPPHEKSKALIALQLLKRWRNVRYDGRDGRRPPSIMMSKLVADNAGHTQTLAEELLYQAEAMFSTVYANHQQDRLLRVVNPVCPDDVFTDRWPASLRDQEIFVQDLRDLVIKLRRMMAGCDLAEMKKIMEELFGETPTGEVFREFAKRTGTSIASGNSQHHPGRGALSLVASAGVGAGLATAAGAVTTRPHTFYGD